MTKIEELLKNEKVEWKKLGEVCEFKRGQTITKNKVVQGDVPVIAGGQKPAYYHNKSNREGITIAIAGSGAYAGFVSYWDNPIFLSDAFSIEPNNQLNIRYLYHWLLSKQNKIYELKQGSGIPHVYGKDLSRFEIPIPSLETQEKIVKILDKFTNYVTELQSELQSRTKQYNYYRDKLLSEEYLNKISEEMDNTEEKNNKFIWTTLEKIVNIVVGGDIPKNNFSLTKTQEYKIPIYSNGVGDKSLYGYTDNAKVMKKSVTISARGTIGYVSLKEEPYYPAVRLICLIPKEDLVLSRYLYYFLQNIKFNYVQTGIPSLTSDMIKKINIFLPLIYIQEKIVEVLDKFQELLKDTKGLLPKEIELRQKQYEYYREKLLNFQKND